MFGERLEKGIMKGNRTKFLKTNKIETKIENKPSIIFNQVAEENIEP